MLTCERQLTRAERTADAKLLAALLAREFLGVDLHGRKVSRRNFIAAFLRPELQLRTLRIDQVSMRLHGPIAIVIGRSHFTGTFADRAIAGQGRFTDVWRQRERRWQLIASAVTRIAS